jgi:predicted Zn finger-like uncharacterized protein
MLLNCNSCQKKFIVPDNAIKKTGRLVQCGSCGNKWTQYPIKNNVPKKEVNVTVKKSPTKGKISINKTVSKKNLYTLEYLKKKHGIDIGKPNKPQNVKLQNFKQEKSGFGFYSYLFLFIIFLSTAFGVLNLTKKLIIMKYPISESYINYLYEVINIIKVSLNELIYYFIN